MTVLALPHSRRRNASEFDRVAVGLKAKPALEARAKARQATSTGGESPQLKEKFPEGAGQVRDEIGAKAGDSGSTVDKVEKQASRLGYSPKLIRHSSPLPALLPVHDRSHIGCIAASH